MEKVVSAHISYISVIFLLDEQSVTNSHFFPVPALTLRTLARREAESRFTGSSMQAKAGSRPGARPKRASHRLWSFEIVSDRLGSVLTSATFLSDTALSSDGEQPFPSTLVSWETYPPMLMFYKTQTPSI